MVIHAVASLILLNAGWVLQFSSCQSCSLWYNTMLENVTLDLKNLKSYIRCSFLVEFIWPHAMSVLFWIWMHFLIQVWGGLSVHIWISFQGADQQASCRYDWHQTSSDVVVSVFAKKYDPDSSSVQLNPIRLKVHLFFPEEQSVFNLDLELCGVRIQMFLSGQMDDWKNELNTDRELCVRKSVIHIPPTYGSAVCKFFFF